MQETTLTDLRFVKNLLGTEPSSSGQLGDCFIVQDLQHFAGLDYRVTFHYFYTDQSIKTVNGMTISEHHKKTDLECVVRCELRSAFLVPQLRAKAWVRLGMPQALCSCYHDSPETIFATPPLVRLTKIPDPVQWIHSTNLEETVVDDRSGNLF